MTEPGLQRSGLPHAVFLDRLAGTAEGASDLEPRLGRAAFLALRLVDMLSPEHDGLHADAFHYQYTATSRCCDDLPATHTERSHLVGLVEVTSDAFAQRNVSLVLPALFAYAHYLEEELQLEEALDVLDEALYVGGTGVPPADAVALRLRRARVLRKLNEFDKADKAYAEGGELAVTIGDTHSELLSRIGRGDTLRGRGNLLEAESALRAALADAEASGDREARARAHQVMAVVLGTRGQPIEAIPHIWQAFQSYDDDLSRTRTLADLGALLLIVGDPQGAERALQEVVQRGAPEEAVNNALVELMNCASFRRDRVGFERWRERSEQRHAIMPQNVLVDFLFKSGIGFARFEHFDRAERLLTRALQTAEKAGLHEFTFRIERIKAGLRDCAEAAAEPVALNQAVREVSAALAHLGEEH